MAIDFKIEQVIRLYSYEYQLTHCKGPQYQTLDGSAISEEALIERLSKDPLKALVLLKAHNVDVVMGPYLMSQLEFMARTLRRNREPRVVH